MFRLALTDISLNRVFVRSNRNYHIHPDDQPAHNTLTGQRTLTSLNSIIARELTFAASYYPLSLIDGNIHHFIAS